MAIVYLAVNLIDATEAIGANAGHLQFVYAPQDGGPLQEIEVQAPNVFFLGEWTFLERSHVGPQDEPNTPFLNQDGTIADPLRYRRVELSPNNGQSAEDLWTLIGQSYDSFVENGGGDLEYDVNQNSNTFVNSVLYALGYTLEGSLLESVTPDMVEVMPGAFTNVLTDFARFGVFDNRPLPLVIDGSAGNDIIRGGIGADTLSGAAGDDRLEGRNGADTLDGGGGADALHGGSGRDTLIGGDGVDILFGGDGRDIIYTGEPTDAAGDRIRFNVGDSVVNIQSYERGDPGAYVSGGRGDDIIAVNAALVGSLGYSVFSTNTTGFADLQLPTTALREIDWSLLGTLQTHEAFDVIRLEDDNDVMLSASLELVSGMHTRPDTATNMSRPFTRSAMLV